MVEATIRISAVKLECHECENMAAILRERIKETSYTIYLAQALKS